MDGQAAILPEEGHFVPLVGFVCHVFFEWRRSENFFSSRETKWHDFKAHPRT